MPTIKLTDAAVKRLKAPPGERVDYFDATLPGFALRVAGPTPRNKVGRKTWTLHYRFGGKQHRLTIEPGYPALSLKDARRRAGKALDFLSEGKDPASDKAQRKAEAKRGDDIVEAAVQDFIHDLATRPKRRGGMRSPRYVEETQRNLMKHVVPHWRGRKLKDITRREVNRVVRAVADGQKNGGGPIAANRTLSSIQSLFAWAVRQGLVDATPATFIDRPGEETARERALNDAEIKTFWSATECLNYPFRGFFRLALLTGQRRNEIARITWDEIDETEKLWNLGAGRTKANRAHLVPLSDLVLREIDEAKPWRREGPYVFSTTGVTPISGFGRAKERLQDEMAAICKSAAEPAIQPWTIHDLRRTCATGLGNLGIPRFVIQRILNHADVSTTGIYDRALYMDQKREALDMWAGHLRDLINPPPKNVVDLRRKA